MSVEAVAISLGVLLIGGWFLTWLSLREPEIPIAKYGGVKKVSQDKQ